MSNYRLTVNYLPWSRYHYSELLIRTMSEIRSSIKSQMLFRIHSEYAKSDEANKMSDLFSKMGIEAQVLLYKNSMNYPNKMASFSKTDAEYSCKLDEDCFISSFLWEFIYENLPVLSSSPGSFLVPQMSSGIPTVEGFLEDNFSSTDVQAVHSSFLRTSFGVIWGKDYSSLNRYTTGATTWDSESFYSAVASLPYYYKGIHPIRINKEAHDLIHAMVLREPKKLLRSGDYRLVKLSRPYACNSLFFIKTKDWVEIFRHSELFVDSFDEVPLNLYRDLVGGTMYTVRGGFGVNTIYNTVPDFIATETRFYKSLRDNILGASDEYA